MPELERTALYRCFATDGTLLYVGITNKPPLRWAQHERLEEWWPDVAKLWFEWLPTRDEAEAAEETAIRSERPLHNRKHNRTPYRGGQFPAVNLIAMIRDHFGKTPFTYRDLVEALGVPYGTATVYGRRFEDQGILRQVGYRPTKGQRSKLFVLA